MQLEFTGALAQQFPVNTCTSYPSSLFSCLLQRNDRQHWIRVTTDGDVDWDDDRDDDDDDDDDDDVDGDDEGEADGVDDNVDDFDDRVHATIATTLEQDDAIIHRAIMTIAYITTPRSYATRDLRQR